MKPALFAMVGLPLALFLVGCSSETVPKSETTPDSAIGADVEPLRDSPAVSDLGSARDSGDADLRSPDPDSGGSVPYTKDDNGIPWNNDVTAYGTLIDPRDGQMYRTVEIGMQTWMAENLSYQPSDDGSSWCYQNSDELCPKYGRLYTWSEVLAGATSSAGSTGGVVGICPTGWHVPTVAEWSTLVAFAENDPRVGTENGARALKSTSGWNEDDPECSGRDLFGFRALAAGLRYFDGYFMNLGVLGFWWTTTETDASMAQCCDMNSGFANVSCHEYDKTVAFSLRCLKD